VAGLKTVRVPSVPEIVTSADGVTEVLERADISGSGIGTIIGFPGVEPGDVSLIAPLGTINAGEAGIRISGNLNLAALYVPNASNFQAQILPARAASIGRSPEFIRGTLYRVGCNPFTTAHHKMASISLRFGPGRSVIPSTGARILRSEPALGYPLTSRSAQADCVGHR
jgi:hypothetical protein